MCVFVPVFHHFTSDVTGFCVSESQRRGGNSANQQGRLLGPSAGFYSILSWVSDVCICSFVCYKKNTKTQLLRGMKKFADGRRPNERSRRDKCWRGRGGRWMRSRRRRGRREGRRELSRSNRRGKSDTQQNKTTTHTNKESLPLIGAFCVCVHGRIYQKQREEEEREREQQQMVIWQNTFCPKGWFRFITTYLSIFPISNNKTCLLGVEQRVCWSYKTVADLPCRCLTLQSSKSEHKNWIFEASLKKDRKIHLQPFVCPVWNEFKRTHLEHKCSLDWALGVRLSKKVGNHCGRLWVGVHFQ